MVLDKKSSIINIGNINKLFNGFYKKYRETILMNKNLLIAGIFGFLVSATIAEIYAIYSPSDILTSTITVLVGFISYKISFIVLFHIDNKRKYTNRFTSQINFNRLKQIIKKMIFAWSCGINTKIRKLYTRIVDNFVTVFIKMKITILRIGWTSNQN